MTAKWQESIRHQDELATLWLAAVARHDFDQTAAYAALLEMNSEHMDDIQKTITLLVEDPNFTLQPVPPSLGRH
jgi:hypothetical protein